MPPRTQRPYAITGEGTPFQEYSDLLWQEAQRLQVADRFFAVGGLDHNAATAAHRSAPRYGTVDLGLKPGEVRDAGGFLGDPAVAASRRHAWLGVALRTNDKLIAAQRANGLDVAFSVNIYSEFGGHTLPFIERLSDRHTRHTGEIRLGLAVVSHEPYLQDHLREEPYLPVILKDEGLLETTIEVYGRTMIAQRYGRPYQNRLVCKGVMGLIAAPHHFPNQKTAPDITHALGRAGARVAMGFGLTHLTPLSPETGLRSLWHAFHRGGVSVIHIDDVVPQVQTAITQAFGDPAWRTMEDDPSPSSQAAVVIHLPLKRRSTDESRVWRGVVATVDHWLSNEYPNVIPLWVAGFGLPMPGLEEISPLWVQASAFWALPDLPRTIEQIIVSGSGREADAAGQAITSDLGHPPGLHRPAAAAPDLRPVVTAYIPS